MARFFIPGPESEGLPEQTEEDSGTFLGTNGSVASWDNITTLDIFDFDVAGAEDGDVLVYDSGPDAWVATKTPAPMRGAISRQTQGTVVINSADTYVPINLSPTLDVSTSVNMSLASSPNVTGLKNDVGQERVVVIIATYDGKAGNNQSIGLKLALNGIPIDETECTSFAGPAGQFSKTMTQWIMRLDAGDEVSMLAANKESTADISIARLKMIAYSIP